METISHPETQIVIIGAGVIGAAIAATLSEQGKSCLVLEAEERECTGISSRNSGVVHAGIYYPAGSLKSSLCIEGNQRLWDWCKKFDIRSYKTEKLIVGQEDEIPELESLLQHAKNCGAEGLRLITRDQLKILEPDIRGAAAIFSATTGIVDVAHLTQSLMYQAQSAHADFLFNCSVSSIDVRGAHAFDLHTTRGTIRTAQIINCGGLSADKIAGYAGINKYQIYPWRGSYFKLKRPPGPKRLIYPSKSKNTPGLGIHLTMDTAGDWKLGPDVETCTSRDNFSMTPLEIEKKAADFLGFAKRYLPGLSENDLSFDYCGIRPKLRSPSDTTEKDFVIAEDLPGFINLVGIESPGITACLSISRKVAAMIL